MNLPSSPDYTQELVEKDYYHVTVGFGKGIPSDLQGVALLRLEKLLREAGIPAEVYKEAKPDDSRLRLSMTENKRKTL